MKKIRNTNIDVIKGLCILMVVAIHAISTSYYDSFAGYTIRNIFNCAVPIFLGISAYLTSKVPDNTNSYKIFLSTRCTRLYIPTLFWSIPFLVQSIYLGKNSIEIELIKFFICGYSIYYFIAVLLQYNILIIPMNYLAKNRKGVAFSFIVSIISILFVTYILHFLNISLPLIIYAGFFPLWLVFFVFGLYLRKYNLFSLKISFIAAIITLLISTIETYIYSSGFENIKGGGIKLSSFLFSFCMLQLAIHWIKSFNPNSCKHRVYLLLKEIGNQSFGIYLIHIPVLIVVRKLLIIDSILQFIITLIFSILIITIAKKILPQFILKYIGFI